jgi:hypothetical protein
MAMPTPASQKLLEELMEGRRLTASELDKLLVDQPNEDEYLDYKSGLLLASGNIKKGRATVRQYLSGFANSEGGVLVVGVNDAKPHAVDGCPPQGSTPLDEWAQSCVSDMAPYFSPQPRIHVVTHPGGNVLVAAVGRAPQLVPCIEEGKLKYFLRMHHSTIEAPPYLISDLVLGRRRDPVIDLKVRDISIEAAECIAQDGSSVYQGLGFGFSFLIESLSLAPAEEVEVGMVWWTAMKEPVSVSRQLLPYIDATEPDSEGFERPLWWRLHHAHNDLMKQRPAVLRPFGEIWASEIVRAILPAVPRALLRCAVYALPRGASPTWFELEYDYRGGYPGDRQNDKRDTLKRVQITRLGTGRPRVTWELLK